MKKFTRNQSIVILAGLVIWILLMFACYGLGYAAHAMDLFH